MIRVVVGEASILDARTAPRRRGEDGEPLGPITVNERFLLLLIEGFCRSRCFCWVGNAELAAAYGCEASNLGTLLKRLEHDGLIYRVLGGGDRIGIALRVRSDPDLPVATEADLPELRGWIAQAIAEERSRKFGIYDPGKSVAPPAGSPRNIGTEEGSLTLNQDELEEGPAGSEDLQRQRQEREAEVLGEAEGKVLPAAAPPPCPVVMLGEAALASAVMEDGPSESLLDLAPGQVQWLATLPADWRANFETLAPSKRDWLLAMHVDGPNPDRVVLAEVRAALSPRAPAPPVREMPGSTAELLEQLPGAPAGWADAAAEAMVRDFGAARDRELWRAFYKVTTAVWEGAFPARAVVDAYNQGRKPGVRKPGAVFNHALQAHGWRW